MIIYAKQTVFLILLMNFTFLVDCNFSQKFKFEVCPEICKCYRIKNKILSNLRQVEEKNLINVTACQRSVATNRTMTSSDLPLLFLSRYTCFNKVLNVILKIYNWFFNYCRIFSSFLSFVSYICGENHEHLVCPLQEKSWRLNVQDLLIAVNHGNH